MRRALIFLAVLVGVIVGAPAAALACGSLVAPNGSVQLVRTTTLVAHVDGVEHYVTNFEFAGPVESFGSIIPLPGEPSDVQRGGDWTLQRLVREVEPPVVRSAGEAVFAAEADSTVEILLETRIDSLDVTVLRGGGLAVAEWAEDNDFALPLDTPDVLERYSEMSPYFLAAKFDAETATADEFVSGDGIPVHVSIPLDHAWVPLQILAAGKSANDIVEADVFVLTEERPLLYAGPGLELELSERASRSLLDDLRSDEGMDWVPDDMWLSYVSVDLAAEDLDFDLAIDPPGQPFSVTNTTEVVRVQAPGTSNGDGTATLLAVLGAVGGVAALGAGIAFAYRDR